MKGYAKIKLENSCSKSRSMDFSDQTINTTPRIKNPISVMKSTITTQQQQQQPKIQDDRDDDDDDDYKHYSSNHQEQDGNFPIQMLTRNRSVASRGTTDDANSTSSHHSSRFKIEKQNSTGKTLHTAVVRAMSIRRSSSVSERYSRIHDQYANTFDVDDHVQDEELKKTGSKNNMKKQNKGSILKACKRIFGL